MHPLEASRRRAGVHHKIKFFSFAPAPARLFHISTLLDLIISKQSSVEQIYLKVVEMV